MERSYGFPSNYFQNKHLIAHLRDLYYKGLDVPSSIPLITGGFSSHPYMMKELRLPLDFSSTLFKIIKLYYISKSRVCFENSLKEIHSFAPSFNPRRATQGPNLRSTAGDPT
jgi:hypothetical protein